MIQSQELNASGPLAAAASAGLLLLAAWLFLRLRRNPAPAMPAARRETRLSLLVASVDGPPPALALTASLFLHLIALSLIPFAGILAPGIVPRPSATGFILIEYRLPRGVLFDTHWRSGRPLELPSAGDSAIQSPAAREEIAPIRPAPRQKLSKDAGTGDIAVARFDTVIQVFPPARPSQVPLAESGQAPTFVLDWPMPRARPAAALLAEVAPFRENAAALAQWGALPEFAARERFELPGRRGGAFANAALAEYGAAMGGLPEGAANSPGQPGGAPPEFGALGALPLDGQSGLRSLPYLISLLPASGAAWGYPSPLGAAEEGDGSGSAEREQQAAAGGESPVRPLERRRYGIILVRSGARGQIPEADGWLTGNPIYTVYLNVPGSARNWVLQFCRPGSNFRRLEFLNGVIRLLPRRALDPPFARRTQAPSLNLEAGAGWQRAVVFANLDSAGVLSNVQLLAGPGGESGELILSSLRAWEFLPAFEGGKPVAVEAIFSIPLD